MSFKYIHSELSHRGRVRSQNEDSFISKMTKNGHLFVVCDGMGGAVGGKRASSIAVNKIVEYIDREVYSNKNFALSQAIHSANKNIYAQAQANPRLRGMGTTCCALLIANTEIYFAHVGDSRIYLYSDEELFHLTKDHSYVMKLLEQGVITVEESYTHRDKNRILRALGVQSNVEPTLPMMPVSLKKNDMILIFSDGLNDMVDDHSILEILSDNASHLDSKTHDLVNLAIQNGGKDNITVQSILITESPYTISTFQDQSVVPRAKNSSLRASGGNKTKLTLPILMSILLGISVLTCGTLLLKQPLKIKEWVQFFKDDDSSPKKEEITDEPPIKEELDEKSKREKQELLLVQASDQVRICVDFAKKFPESKYLHEVEELAYDRAVAQNSIGAYAVYFNYSQFNRFRDDVEAAAWARAKSKNTNDAYNRYIKHFTKNKESAQKKLKALEASVSKKKEKKVEEKPTTEFDKTKGFPEYVTIDNDGEFKNLHSNQEAYKKINPNITVEYLEGINDIKDVTSIDDGTIIYLVKKSEKEDGALDKTKKEETEDPDALKDGKMKTEDASGSTPSENMVSLAELKNRLDNDNPKFSLDFFTCLFKEVGNYSRLDSENSIYKDLKKGIEFGTLDAADRDDVFELLKDEIFDITKCID